MLLFLLFVLDQGGLNKFHGQHALRERARKLDQGILIIRFVFCETLLRILVCSYSRMRICTPVWTYPCVCLIFLLVGYDMDAWKWNTGSGWFSLILFDQLVVH